MVSHRVEPQTRAGYFLYLPDDYVARKGQRADHQRWPLVVTFHGLRPWDDANPQIREWQQEADRYGLIVIAPELRTCDSLFMRFPLRDPTMGCVQRDEKATLAIMDEVLRETNADPSRVLATSFSSGGYMAHFMVNRHPERFSCLAVRQSNFSEDLLSPSQIPKYRNMRVAIFFGENDLPICREESVKAVEWYRRYRFPVEAKYVMGLAHERTPQTAAAFFAAIIGVNPKTPPNLGQMVLKDIPTDNMASLPPRGEGRRTPPPASESPAPTAPLVDRRPPDRNVVFGAEPSPEPASMRPPVRVPPSEPSRRSPPPLRTPPSAQATPKRPVHAQPYSSGNLPGRSDKRDHPPTIPQREQKELDPIPAQIRVHGRTEGPAPMWLSVSVDMPPGLREGASIRWADNGRPIGANDFEAQSLLREPGDHTIEARIVTADDRTVVLREQLKVLPPATHPAGF